MGRLGEIWGERGWLKDQEDPGSYFQHANTCTQSPDDNPDDT